MRRALLAVLLVVSACGDAAGDVAPAAATAETVATAAPTTSVTTTTVATTSPEAVLNMKCPCPLTIPDGTFVPPEPWPAEASVGVWYGTDDLWTVLSADGVYIPTKGVWWSANFPGGNVEEQPDISVVARRLDAPGEMRTEHIGTNAYTAADGWFMINGVDPESPGCWELTATYKGATLTYTYQVP